MGCRRRCKLKKHSCILQVPAFSGSEHIIVYWTKIRGAKRCGYHIWRLKSLPFYRNTIEHQSTLHQGFRPRGRYSVRKLICHQSCLIIYTLLVEFAGRRCALLLGTGNSIMSYESLINCVCTYPYYMYLVHTCTSNESQAAPTRAAPCSAALRSLS